MPESSAKQFSGIFVSYRRDDSSGHTGRLFDRLVAHFGRDRIFMDIDTIEAGEDFVTAIENAVGSCEILLAIIGRHWLSGVGETGLLDNPNDFVRLEITTALGRDIRVIPVLVQRAAMPKPHELPDDLTRLSRRNAIELSDPRWQNDVDHLISVIERILAQRDEAGPKTREPDQREAETRRSEARHREAKLRRSKEPETGETEEDHQNEAEQQRREAKEKEAHRRAETTSRKRLRTIILLVIGLVIVALVFAGVQRKFFQTRSNISLQTSAKPDRIVMGMELVYVPPGEFMMGSSEEEVKEVYNYVVYQKHVSNHRTELYNIEKPQHRVTINQPFYLGKYEVTIGQWKTVMGDLPQGMKEGGFPGRFKETDRQPVVAVSWNDAQQFIAKLNALNDGYLYQLPSEAEWEYACRAKTTGWYAGNVDLMAWYADNSGLKGIDSLDAWGKDPALYNQLLGDNGNKTHAVGTKQANAFGLYDMHGNVWEWCEDYYHENYNNAPTDGTAWLTDGDMKFRVARGGSWRDGPNWVRASVREPHSPDCSYIPNCRSDNLGFRVVAIARTH